MKYHESDVSFPVIAFDFDGVIGVGSSQIECDEFPVPPGNIRQHTEKVINFMHKLGIKIIIWTCRETTYNNSGELIDHIIPMTKFLDDNNIHFDAVNNNITTYDYDARKLFAHMYVDDKAYGWNGKDDGNDEVMFDILDKFLTNVCKFSKPVSDVIVSYCKNSLQPKQWMVDRVSIVKNWKTNAEYKILEVNE